MKTSFLVLSLFVIFLTQSFAQLANQNTYLLRNLDVVGRSYSACWGYTAPNGREYAILGFNAGTAFVDITDSANIHEVDVQPGLSSSWREMKVYSHYAYIVSEATNSRLQIVDLQYLPDSVSLVKTWSYTGYDHTHSISQSGNFLYLHGGNVTTGGTSAGGVAVIDLTDPVNPVKRGQWSTRYVHDSRVLNDTIWTANISSGRVSIVKAINKDTLTEITNFQNLPSPAPHNCAITKDRKYLLVTDENMTPGKLKVWDIQDLTSITFVTSWQPTGITTTIVHNVEIYGNYAVIAHYEAGIRIVNISNPLVPVEVAWYDTRPSSNNNNYNGCWGVYKFPSGKIIGSDIANGLFVIKTTFSMADITNKHLNLTAFIQGFYHDITDNMTADTVRVFVRQSSPPYSVIDSAKGMLNSLGKKTFVFTAPVNSTGYYISLKHRNMIETWSSGPQTFSNDTLNYDFTSAATQAFGNNLSHVDLSPDRYACYNGDVNQDGSVNLSDIVSIQADVVTFVSGYVVTDLNGDNLSNLPDLLLAVNNASGFVVKITP